MSLRDTKKSCGRLRLLKLSIASSIQQGGASEPGAQPGQAGASAKHGGAGVGRMMQNGGWCACVMEDGAEVLMPRGVLSRLGAQLWLRGTQSSDPPCCHE